MSSTSGGGNSVKLTLRDWYIVNYCNDSAVQQMHQIQKLGANHVTFWTRYLLFWSFFGDYLFYITVLPALSWCGMERDGYVMATMLSFGMYLTDSMKDVFAAPRPPCPPLRRGGHHGHSLEYGLPSTHACNASILAVELAIFFSKAYPHLTLFIWAFALVFTIHVCFARVWLGMHWPGDIWGGLVCFAFLWLLEFSFLRAFLFHCFDNWNIYPLVFPLLFGHVLLVFHATPRGTCPCFEDSARFLGVLVGCTIGQWERDRLGYPVLVLDDRSKLFGAMLTLNFLKRVVTGLAVTAIVKAISGAIFTKALKHFFNIASGSLAPQLGKIPPLLFLYKAFCFAVGLLLGKNIRMDATQPYLTEKLFRRGNAKNTTSQLAPPSDAGYNNTNNANSSGVVSRNAARAGNMQGSTSAPQQQQPPLQINTQWGHSTGAHGLSSLLSGDYGEEQATQIVIDTLVKTAEEVAYGSPTVIAPPPPPGANINPDTNVILSAPNTTSTISSAMGQTGVSININPDREMPGNPLFSPNNSNATPAAAGIDAKAGNGGRYWSLRNHAHWWEHELQSKYLSYTLVGVAVTFFAPISNYYIWGQHTYQQ